MDELRLCFPPGRVIIRVLNKKLDRRSKRPMNIFFGVLHLLVVGLHLVFIYEESTLIPY